MGWESAITTKVVQGHRVDTLPQDVLGHGLGQGVTLEQAHTAYQQSKPGTDGGYMTAHGGQDFVPITTAALSLTSY